MEDPGEQLVERRQELERIRELEEEIERLRHLAYYDHLTGVLNRAGFKHEAVRQFETLSLDTTTIERRLNRQIPFSALMIDLDKFKSINDEYGHEVGDEALAIAAETIKNTLRSEDLVGRWGGEEFVVALAGADTDIAQQIAEKLRSALEAVEFRHRGQRIPLTASIGVAEHHNSMPWKDLVSAADKAMYQAKQKGRNRVEVAPREPVDVSKLRSANPSKKLLDVK